MPVQACGPALPAASLEDPVTVHGRDHLGQPLLGSQSASGGLGRAGIRAQGMNEPMDRGGGCPPTTPRSAWATLRKRQEASAGAEWGGGGGGGRRPPRRRRRRRRRPTPACPPTHTPVFERWSTQGSKGGQQRSNNGQTVVKKWSNSSQIAVNSGQIAVKRWSNSGQAAAKRR